MTRIRVVLELDCGDEFGDDLIASLHSDEPLSSIDFRHQNLVHEVYGESVTVVSACVVPESDACHRVTPMRLASEFIAWYKEERKLLHSRARDISSPTGVIFSDDALTLYHLDTQWLDSIERMVEAYICMATGDKESVFDTMADPRADRTERESFGQAEPSPFYVSDGEAEEQRMKISIYMSDRIETGVDEAAAETTTDRNIEVECSGGPDGMKLAKDMLWIAVNKRPVPSPPISQDELAKLIRLP